MHAVASPTRIAGVLPSRPGPAHRDYAKQHVLRPPEIARFASHARTLSVFARRGLLRSPFRPLTLDVRIGANAAVGIPGYRGGLV